MAKYIKKPVGIEAVQFFGFEPHPIDTTRSDTMFSEYPDWLIQALKSGPIVYIDPNVLAVNTLEGRMIISKDDYIIKGVKGEIYPCKPDIFEMSYDVYHKTLGGMLDEQR